MNINELLKPDIPPAKLPKIVLDQDKEQQYHAGQTISYPMSTQNANPAPSKGGFMHQVSGYLEQQQRLQQQAQQRQQPARPVQINQANRQTPPSPPNTTFTRPKKNSGSMGKFIAVGLFVFFFSVGAISDFVEENASNDSTNPQITIDSTGPSTDEESETVFVTKQTSCISIAVPQGVEIEEADDNACEIDFDRGFTISSTAFVFDGEYYTDSAEELITQRSQVILDTREINGRTMYRVDTEDSLQSAHQYLIWVRDLGIEDDNGDIIESITLFLYGANPDYPYTHTPNELADVEFVLNSVEIIAQ